MSACPTPLAGVPQCVDVLRRFAISWACNLAALFVATRLVHGVGYGHDAWTLVVAALVFSLVNRLVKPVVTVLGIPLIVLTLGVALFFVNLLMLELTAWLVPGFHLDGFWAAVGATFVVWVVNALLTAAFRRAERRRTRWWA
jgi:putative membrane protein